VVENLEPSRLGCLLFGNPTFSTFVGLIAAQRWVTTVRRIYRRARLAAQNHFA